MRGTKTIALLICALVFFLMAGTAISDTGVQFLSNDNTSITGNTRRGLFDLGYSENSNIHILSETSIITEFSKIATVYANITPDFYTIAVVNNTLLNHKGKVWIVAHKNITVNNLFTMQPDDTRLYTNMPPFLEIQYLNQTWIVKLRQINSVSEIEDLQEGNETGQLYDTLTIVRYSITGIPAFVFALGLMLALVAFRKDSTVTEGLWSEY